MPIKMRRVESPLLKAQWQEEHLVASAEQYFEELCQDIDNAQYNIILEAYIFKNDRVGQRIIFALKQAVQRGVNIKLLIDGIGSLGTAADIAHELSNSGIEVKIYHPPPWYLRAYRWSREEGHNLRKLFIFFMELNRRNHRKLIVIDDQIAWVGSFNIADDHLSEKYGGNSWRDYAARVTGPEVLRLSENFQLVWQKKRRQPGSGFLTHYLSNLSPYSRRLKRRFILRQIAKAQRQLWICSAYFSPSGALVRAIKRASRRGVDVRLIVPSRSDVMLFPALTASYYSDLIKHGIKVYEYQQHFYHAKALLIDQQIIIGSTNLNHRSLLHDLELDILLSHEQTISDFKQLHEDDLIQSRQVTLTELPRYRKLLMLSWLPRLIRYWM